MRKMLALTAVTLALTAFAAAPALACGWNMTQTAKTHGTSTTQTAENPQTPKPTENTQ